MLGHWGVIGKPRCQKPWQVWRGELAGTHIYARPPDPKYHKKLFYPEQCTVPMWKAVVCFSHLTQTSLFSNPRMQVQRKRFSPEPIFHPVTRSVDPSFQSARTFAGNSFAQHRWITLASCIIARSFFRIVSTFARISQACYSGIHWGTFRFCLCRKSSFPF